jgi:hypothetical protein
VHAHNGEEGYAATQNTDREEEEEEEEEEGEAAVARV